MAIKLINPTQGAVPIGAIVIWSGAVAAIPARWQLCDGTNGTPDLRNRFVPGAGLAYNPGDTGGSSGAHSHLVGTLSTSPSASTQAETVSGASFVNTSNHIHAITGSTAGTVVLPPYYALCYIQFMG